MAYLDVAGFKLESEMPSVFVDALETEEPGFLDTQLESGSRWLDARLRKRYAVPFVEPYPKIVLHWLALIVTPRAWRKRGLDANDQQYVDVKAAADAAVLEVLEAANSETGLFDLPTLDEADGSAVSKGGPQSYTEASPYVFTDEQATVGREEDAAGSGTLG